MGRAAQKPFDVIVLAGGSGRRMGGVDKAALDVDGTPLLDRVINSCGDARRVVVVGPRRPTVATVIWTSEHPAGSGPVAGIAAGMEALPLPTARTVVVLATDLPYLTTDAVHRLVTEHDVVGRNTDAILYDDAQGRRQPLCAAYDATALTAVLRRFRTLDGIPAHAIVDQLNVRTVPDRGITGDIDAPDDLARARAIMEAGPQ